MSAAPVRFPGGVRFEPAAPSLVDLLRCEILPRLSADQVYTDPSHNWTRSIGKWRGACPWHASKSGGSFNVSLDNLLWYCAGCGFGGDPVQYIWRLRGGIGSVRGQDFVDIVRELARTAGVVFPERQLSAEDLAVAEARAAKRAALETVYRRCQDELWSDRGEAARAYLHERGLNDDAITDLGLGLYPQLCEIRGVLAGAGYGTSENEGAWDKLTGFVTFPWHDEYGHALTLYGRWPGRQPPADGRAKTLALPGEGSKASPLYFERARRFHRRDIVMVEGLLDAAVAQSRGLTDVVAYVGGQPSYAQLRTLHRCGIRAVTICPDPDAGGNAGIVSFVKNVDPSIRAYVAPDLPDSHDPDEFIIEHGEDAWHQHVGRAVRGAVYRASTILRESDLTSAKGRDDALDALSEYATGLPARDLDDIVELAVEPLRMQPATLRAHLDRPPEVGRIGSASAPDDPQRIHSAETTHLTTAETKSLFRTAHEIGAETPDQVPWIVEGVAAEGVITEADGKLKASGKTTFLLNMTAKVVEGDRFLDRDTTRTGVVILTEQNTTSFRAALARAGLLERDDVVVLFWADARNLPWPVVVQLAEAKAHERGYRLLIVDTLPQFAGISGDGENSSGAALEAMRPLQEAAAAGLAVVISRHERKGGGEVGESARGSSAFSGAVDIVFSIRRAEGQTRESVRVIQALSRFDETPAELVIDLVDGEYRVLGTMQDVKAQEASQALLDELPVTEADAIEMKAVAEVFKDSKIKRTTLQTAITEHVEAGTIRRIGAGKKGDPFKYWRPEAPKPASPQIHSAEAPVVSAESISDGVEMVDEVIGRDDS